MKRKGNEMGQMNDIYLAYLADFEEKHPNVVKPITYSWAQPIKSYEMSNTDVLTKLRGRYWGDDSFPKVYKSTDGKIIEIGQSQRGDKLYAVWNSLDDFNTYETAKSFRTFFGQW